LPKIVRRRYIAVRIDSDQTIERKDFIRAVWSSILRLFGEHGASQTELKIIDYDPAKGLAVLRCSHKALPMIKASIPCITHIGASPVAIHVERVSGTLKALRRKLSL